MTVAEELGVPEPLIMGSRQLAHKHFLEDVSSAGLSMRVRGQRRIGVAAYNYSDFGMMLRIAQTSFVDGSIFEGDADPLRLIAERWPYRSQVG